MRYKPQTADNVVGSKYYLTFLVAEVRWSRPAQTFEKDTASERKDDNLRNLHSKMIVVVAYLVVMRTPENQPYVD